MIKRLIARINYLLDKHQAKCPHLSRDENGVCRITDCEETE